MSAVGEGRLVERSGRALGSPLRLTFVGRDPDMDAAWTATQQVFADVDATMSRFRDDSVLTQLCRQSPEHVERLPRRLVQALVAADRATRITGGSFDPRIVSALERIGYAGAAQSALEAPPVVSPGPAERVLLREGRNGPFALPLPVDLGGIGKGLALRWAARAIDSLFSLEGACSMGDVTGLAYLLDAGGDIVTRGRPSPDEPWAVGIGNPDGDNAPLAVLHLDASRAIATSSVQRLQWTWEGRTVHHLIDPGQGNRVVRGSCRSPSRHLIPPGRKSGPRRCSWRERAGSRARHDAGIWQPGG